MKSYEYHKPQSVKEAIDLIGSLDHAKYIAGGTDVMVMIKQGKLAPANLISLRSISDISYVDTKDGLKIGSGMTHSEIVDNEFIQKRYSALVDAAGNIGSGQIRNVATLGGNICNAAPSADSACPLLVFDAEVVIAGPNGGRTVKIDDFLQGPNKVALEKDEIVTGIHMPDFGEKTGSAYIKHTRRKAMELPILGIAARITIKTGGSQACCKDVSCTPDNATNMLKRVEDEKFVCDDVRIAMSVVAPRPIRAKKAEAALRGKVISEAVLNEIGEIAALESQPRDSIRGKAWYRRDMVKVLTKRAILKSIERILRPDNAKYSYR